VIGRSIKRQVCLLSVNTPRKQTVGPFEYRVIFSERIRQRDGSNGWEDRSMSDQEWDLGGFFARFKSGEFDGHLGKTLDSLSPDQLEDLQYFLLKEGESIWANAYREP